MYSVVQPASVIMSNMHPAEDQPSDAARRDRLAKAVRGRRLAVDLSVRAAADKAGIARGTWIAIEDGSRRTAEINYARVERALGWAPGSVQTVLDGGDPTEQNTSPEKRRAAGDEALIRVMGDDRISDRDKMRIARILIDERERFERERVQRAEELIRAFGDDEL